MTLSPMLDDFDLDPYATEGTRWTRRITGTIGLLFGGGLGLLFAHLNEVTTLMTAGYIGAGALIGGFLGWLFSFYIFVGLLIAIVFAAVLGWQALFGS